MSNQKSGSKKKKHGRNAVYCAAYKAYFRRGRNKRVKVLRHLKKHPNDAQAVEAMKRV